MNMQPHRSGFPIGMYSRRDVLKSGIGFGAVALLGLLNREGRTLAGEPVPHLPMLPQFAAKAKRIIYLFMAGGPSQIDTFDPKPLLNQLDGGSVPESIARNVPRLSRGSGLQHLMASPFRFQQHGVCGMAVSELFPHTAKQVDDLCLIRSLNHRNPVHGPGEVLMLTGTAIGDRPSLGAWFTYGLGSENDNLPWFVVMNANSEPNQSPQSAGWDTGFLPPKYQGTVVDVSRGIRNIRMPEPYQSASRRRQLDLLAELNQKHAALGGEQAELEARIQSYELAFRMQASAPGLFDIKDETQQTRELYGTDDKATASMGKHCLVARRLVEAGVRFVQVRYGGWDAHNRLLENHRGQALATDKPIAGLLIDLKRRGLLDETLVVWGAEFGRTPTMESKSKGRDHSPTAFCYWLAGGGVRGGTTIGRTDDVGYAPVERALRPSDLHATLLHLLGIEQHALSYNHHGRDEIATVFGGDVIQEVLAG